MPEKEPLLETTSFDANESQYLFDGNNKSVEYIFWGKITLFPLFILAGFLVASWFLLYGDKSYFDGYFQSNEAFFGLTGLFLLIFTLFFLVTLLRFIVFKISFTFSANKFTIKKRGVVKSSILEFDIIDTALYYHRTHFSEDQAWIQLIVKEGDQYYSIISWKGKGDQKDRFSRLFENLQKELSKWQNVSKKLSLSNFEIVTLEEITLVCPFIARLRALRPNTYPKYNQFKNITPKAGNTSNTNPNLHAPDPICIADINVTNYDMFFRHFKFTKDLK